MDWPKTFEITLRLTFDHTKMATWLYTTVITLFTLNILSGLWQYESPQSDRNSRTILCGTYNGLVNMTKQFGGLKRHSKVFEHFISLFSNGGKHRHGKRGMNRTKYSWMTYWLVILLLIAGDIEQNPSPVITTVCGECGNYVKTSQNRLLCNGCDIWYHARCERISTRDYFDLVHSEHLKEWICTKCLMPQFSNSFIEELIYNIKENHSASNDVTETTCEDYTPFTNTLFKRRLKMAI